MLKSYGWVGWWGGGVGGLCDYCVSPSPFSLDFGTLDFGTSDSGLTIHYHPVYLFCLYVNSTIVFQLNNRALATLIRLDLELIVNSSLPRYRYSIPVVIKISHIIGLFIKSSLHFMFTGNCF